MVSMLPSKHACGRQQQQQQQQQQKQQYAQQYLEHL